MASEVTSRDIASVAGKRHAHVIRDIRALMTDAYGEDGKNWLGVQEERDERGYCSVMRLSAEVAESMLRRYAGIRMPTRTKELAALATIEQLLGVTLHRQYQVGSYRIDGYDKENNVAYEIDEGAHKYAAGEDAIRERIIKAQLGCRFVRIKV
jgi:very-short-patch-repair endonuclease